MVGEKAKVSERHVYVCVFVFVYFIESNESEQKTDCGKGFVLGVEETQYFYEKNKSSFEER